MENENERETRNQKPATCPAWKEDATEPGFLLN